MDEQQTHDDAEKNAANEPEVVETPSDFCAECGSLLDEEGECTNEQCSNSPYGVEEEEDEVEFDDEDDDAN